MNNVNKCSYSQIFRVGALFCRVEARCDLLTTGINLVGVDNDTLSIDQGNDTIRTILRISPGEQLHRSRFGSVYNWEGKFIKPGLWDAHARPYDLKFGESIPTLPPGKLNLISAIRMRNWL